MPVLIDTSSWTQALGEKGDDIVRRRVLALLSNSEAAWCDMVRIELWNGVRGESEKRRLRELDADLPRLEITSEVWDEACSVGLLARAAGLTVPASDLVIFACARTHRAGLEHNDKHFDLLAKLPGL